jgi:hypothetical protein
MLRGRRWEEQSVRLRPRDRAWGSWMPQTVSSFVAWTTVARWNAADVSPAPFPSFLLCSLCPSSFLPLLGTRPFFRCEDWVLCVCGVVLAMGNTQHRSFKQAAVSCITCIHVSQLPCRRPLRRAGAVFGYASGFRCCLGGRYRSVIILRINAQTGCTMSWGQTRVLVCVPQDD